MHHINIGPKLYKTCRQTAAPVIFIITIFFINFCDGQASNGAMFEIKYKNKKMYMLKDCRKLARNNWDMDCKCVNLGRECQQADVENCKNCVCLKSPARIFYIEKKYGALCLSQTSLFNAAGFGERFLSYNPIYKRCARATTSSSIQYTRFCSFNDPRIVWLWTPGNLLMNVGTSRCLQITNTGGDYLPLSMKPCSSSDLRQKWRCEERTLLWGISFDSPNTTYAVRYDENDHRLVARSVAVKVNDENTWTVFPTNNKSVCSARDNKGIFYLSDENKEISQIDLVPLCTNGKCSRKLFTSTSSDNLSNCSLLWDNNFSSYSEPFMVENRQDGVYFLWQSNPHTRLAGKTLDLTVECEKNNGKFEEFQFHLRVKNITIKRIKEKKPNTGSPIPIVDLDKDCNGNICLVSKIETPDVTDEKTKVCRIQWEESTVFRLDNTDVSTENISELLSFRKVEDEFILTCNLTDGPVLGNITFNLTILCYNDQNEKTTTVAKSVSVFQTRCCNNQKNPTTDISFPTSKENDPTTNISFLTSKENDPTTDISFSTSKENDPKPSLPKDNSTIDSNTTILAIAVSVSLVMLLALAMGSLFCYKRRRHVRAKNENEGSREQNRLHEEALVPLSLIQPSHNNQPDEQYEVPCEHEYEYVDKTAIALNYDYASYDGPETNNETTREELNEIEEDYVIKNDFMEASNIPANEKPEGKDEDTNDDYVIRDESYLTGIESKPEAKEEDTDDGYLVPTDSVVVPEELDVTAIESEPETQEEDTDDGYLVPTDSVVVPEESYVTVIS